VSSETSRAPRSGGKGSASFDEELCAGGGERNLGRGSELEEGVGGSRGHDQEFEVEAPGVVLGEMAREAYSRGDDHGDIIRKVVDRLEGQIEDSVDGSKLRPRHQHEGNTSQWFEIWLVSQE
jgi:hypothetical protein